VNATVTSLAETTGDDDRQFCYRHPDRETWIRCGRCDRPICTSCAMQGPVGSRCKQCGKLAFDRAPDALGLRDGILQDGLIDSLLGRR